MSKSLLAYESFPTVTFVLTVLSLLLSSGTVFVRGWMPRLSKFCNTPKSAGLSSNGVRQDAILGRQQQQWHKQQQSVLLLMGNPLDSTEIDFDDDHDNNEDLGADPRIESEKLKKLISRLEITYNHDSHVDYNNYNTAADASRLWQAKQRVVLGDWLTEGPCLEECCGDECEQCDIPEEYKMISKSNEGTPKVDVMLFLGIKRAEPLRVLRDWD